MACLRDCVLLTFEAKKYFEGATRIMHRYAEPLNFLSALPFTAAQCHEERLVLFRRPNDCG
eukprot:scaffold152375_cov33-Prasinocladus_malaysianus.AAC.1